MLRHLTKDLQIWLKNQTRKPLILRGARQVGKSTVVKMFADEMRYQLHEVNLELHKQLAKSIRSLNVETFLKEVQLICKKGSVESANSILFIDEIQEIPEALTLLRYLYEQKPAIPVIAAGSLLEFTLNSEEREFSMPVGRVSYAYLGPLSFSEFLLANKEDELTNYLGEFSLKDSFSLTAHKQLLELYHLYLLIGGMPEAVKTYLDAKNLQLVSEVHSSIVSTYRDDFAKYSKKSMLSKLQTVFDYSPLGIGKKIKYSNIDPDLRSSILKEALNLLEMAGVQLFAYGTDAIQPPIATPINRNIAKLYFLDCGLLNSLSGHALVPKSSWLLPDYKGKIAEQFIAQHLAFIGPVYEKPALYYWLREGKNQNAEVDFLWQNQSEIIPIEVKSGSTGTLRSLHQFVARAKVEQAVRFNLLPPEISKIDTALTSDRNTRAVSELISLPIYCIEQMPRLVEHRKNK